jgi:RNA polymerase sigma-70 factor (ECF subfamily)
MSRVRNPAYTALFEQEYARLVSALGLAFDDVDASADAVQDAFVQAHRHWRRVAQLEDPGGWLRRVATNRMLNVVRGRRRLAAALPGMWSPDHTDLPPLAIDIARLVDSLPERQRVAVCLFYVADLSTADVAHAMGVSAGTVKSQLHDARRSLRASLEPIEEGDAR